MNVENFQNELAKEKAKDAWDKYRKTKDPKDKEKAEKLDKEVEDIPSDQGELNWHY